MAQPQSIPSPETTRTPCSSIFLRSVRFASSPSAHRSETLLEEPICRLVHRPFYGFLDCARSLNVGSTYLLAFEALARRQLTLLRLLGNRRWIDAYARLRSHD